ncbi:MAG: hypothetical protein FWE79_02770, partial [Firmicutes bacterium]|nr:hypothetical protein [Bacillota bacterium]
MIIGITACRGDPLAGLSISLSSPQMTNGRLVFERTTNPVDNRFDFTVNVANVPSGYNMDIDVISSSNNVFTLTNVIQTSTSRLNGTVIVQSAGEAELVVRAGGLVRRYQVEIIEPIRSLNVATQSSPLFPGTNNLYRGDPIIEGL